MKGWKIAALCAVAALSFACERIGGPADEEDYRSQNGWFPIGETEGMQFGESGAGQGSTGAHNVNSAEQVQMPADEQQGTGGSPQQQR